MSGQIQMVARLLDEMIVSTKDILELDLDREEDVERLLQLQSSQVDLRAKLEAASLTEVKKDSSIRDRMHHCIELEQDVNRKLTIYKNYIKDQLNRIQIGNKSRNLYHSEFSQTGGYFIDSKK